MYNAYALTMPRYKKPINVRKKRKVPISNLHRWLSENIRQNKMKSGGGAILFKHSCHFFVPLAPLADGVGTRGIWEGYGRDREHVGHTFNEGLRTQQNL
jgi:hypothetical protein